MDLEFLGFNTLLTLLVVAGLYGLKPYNCAFADFLIIPQPKNIRTVEFGEIIPPNSISWS
jgi:hypothetical protein